MKALICAINSKYIHSSLAVWYLAGGVEKFAPNTTAEVIEATINEDFEKIYQRISEKSFDIIGFSTYIWNLDIVIKLAERLKQERNIKIILLPSSA